MIRPQKPDRLTLERIRQSGAVLPQETILAASARLLSDLRRNSGHVEKGITPGTTSSQRAEARAFWPRKGDKTP